jgi:NAD(P)-dependent dehydrogenase (short-subunit alcohol dehydrogenase family)
MLAGKTALITGSSSGIGLGVARSFVAHGAKVVTTSERPRAEVPAVDGAFYIQADLLRDGEAERLVAEAWYSLGSIDILVNNLGTYRESSFLELTCEQFDFLFHFNVWSAIAVTQAVVRRGVAAGRGGRILFSSSLNAMRSEPGHTLYDASKGAINALVRQLAIELAPLGFTTAAVAPGLVETPLTDFGLRSDPTGRRAITEQIPLRRIATVEDVAEWYTFLATDRAAYATGTIITVDGGLDAQQFALRPIARNECSPHAPREESSREV